MHNSPGKLRRPPHALIFEPVVGGHHLHYVRNLTQALRGCGAQVTIALGAGAVDSEEYRVHLKGLEAHEVATIADVSERAYRGATAVPVSFLELRRTILRECPDRVYLPYADGLVQLLGAAEPLRRVVFPAVPIEALIMRGAFAYPAARLHNPLRHRLLYQLLSAARVDQLHVLDALVHADIVRRGGRIASLAQPIPEPVDAVPTCSVVEARARLGVPQGGRYIVCAGALDRRKGVDLLLRAAALTQLPRDVKVLLVGKLAPELREEHRALASRLGPSLVTVDRYVTEEDFGYAIVAADVVAVPYPAHQGSSGLLVRALAAGRPLLASDYGWVGWVTQTLRAGLVADVQSAPALARALEKSLEVSRHYALSPIAKRFIAYHTAENQRAHWTRALRQSMGQSGEVPMTWRDVVRGNEDLIPHEVGARWAAPGGLDLADIRQYKQ